jgi:hypothetical protein
VSVSEFSYLVDAFAHKSIPKQRIRRGVYEVESSPI